jgi:uncharacterized membrane protein YoaK (UPF0700 family)
MERFKQDRKYFGFVVSGASFLCVIAGFVNVVCLYGLSGETVTHVTGTVSKLGISSLHDGDKIPNLLGLILSFTTGAFCSSLIVGDSKFQLRNRYGIVMIVESLLLLLAYFLLTLTGFGMNVKYMFAFASGLQNAMATSFSGAVLRTTHMTGVVTDIGIVLAHVIRTKGKHEDAWKLGFLFPLLAGFYLGCALGAASVSKFGFFSILFASTACGIAGCAYFLHRINTQHREFLRRLEEEERQNQAQIREIEQTIQQID